MAKLVVWSTDRGLRTLKEGATLADYKTRHATAIKVRVPSNAQLERYVSDAICPAVDGCRVEPDGTCEHDYPSWLLALRLI